MPPQHIPGCTGKTRYRSVKDAGAAIRVLKAKGRGENRAYPCSHCGGWHLTSWSARRAPI